MGGSFHSYVSLPEGMYLCSIYSRYTRRISDPIGTQHKTLRTSRWTWRHCAIGMEWAIGRFNDQVKQFTKFTKSKFDFSNLFFSNFFFMLAPSPPCRWGEYPGTPPDLQRLGFEAMRDEELPLSFCDEIHGGPPEFMGFSSAMWTRPHSKWW